MIKFKDFFPELIRSNLIGIAKESEPFESVVKQANVWIDSNPIEVINIETVLFPGSHQLPKVAQPDLGVVTVGQAYNLFQCVRVWYREK